MTELNLETCPNCRGIGTVAGCSYTWCSRCDKTGKIAVKRPISKVEEFKSEWTSKYGFPPTDSDIFNAGMLRERNAVPAKPVASMLTDAELTALIRRVEDKLGIVWFVPDDSERYAWRTTNTNERLKYARALLDAAPTQGADARPVAIYQVEQAPGRWTNVSRETFDAWAFGKQIVYATRDAEPSDAQDAERYRWLQRQRSSVWHEVADMPINKAAEFIDAAIAPKDKT